jgi:hypothetical protein
MSQYPTPTPEELEQIMRNAKDLSAVRVRRQEDKIRVDVDGRSYLIPYNEEAYKKLKEVEQEVRSAVGSSRGRTTVPGYSDVALFMTQVKGKRPLVEQLMDKLSWFQGAMLDVGAEALIAILLAYGEDPDRIPQIIQGFNDRSTFVNYVITRLYNLIKLTKECGDTAALREELTEKDLKLSILEEKVNELYAMFSMLNEEVIKIKRMRDIALILMSDEQLSKYSKIIQIMGITESPIIPTESGGGSVE